MQVCVAMKVKGSTWRVAAIKVISAKPAQELEGGAESQLRVRVEHLSASGSEHCR